ncbi:hypothetical protein SAMN05216485_1002199 [Shigella sonnei]|nr:hypothetical protein [Shigella sonnei]SDN69151.1 hypothetical protein SAMN05216485_1002199 [Shigella sonnei]
MAEIEITGGLGSALMHILEAEEIQPGEAISDVVMWLNCRRGYILALRRL